MLVVNTASQCGLTPQYDGLEQLYSEYRDRGLVVLGVPCNQFAGQEPGSNKEIAEFCQLNYGVSFPMFSKSPVKGAGAIPLFAMFAGKMITKIAGVYPTTKVYKYAQKEGVYTTLLMSTGLTFGSISALFGLTHGIIDKAMW